MASYRQGDVLLARVRIEGRDEAKIRPVVVLRQDGNDTLRVLPVTSRHPAGTPHVPLGLYDYATGGLDFFEESYVLTASECTVRIPEVRSRKGKLAREPMEEICASIPKSSKKSGGT
jgi:mRNA-degrading endonuclease toxin of MazEF toxin-antitoxin module